MTKGADQNDSARERSFEVDGLIYAGLEWGKPEAPLALALHGWLDNALSFSILGPLLNRCRILALDLSGHGLSSHRSADASYQIWDDVPQLASIIEQLGEDSVTLIGHSRGAAISTLLASVLGDQCHRLVLIDGMLPPEEANSDAAAQLRRFVRERTKYRQRPQRIFDSIEDFIERRARYGFAAENGEFIAPRALRQVNGGWCLRSDPRLYGASAHKLTAADRRHIYQQINAPVLGLFGDKGLYERRDASRVDEPQSIQRLQGELSDCLPDYRSTILSGSHHLHMESCAHEVARHIDDFI
ncbi:hydrolase [Luminiphilus syltensis NOR5-1B]|uniref:Hydrolase n=1 Tax=Luminiphilus syltensis NOR5-1B TaxID=565045 RepID=B8KRR7_9GAMM|nr:alpha/beta hydrolase [Luminiphilus syltensis]EED34871.1 hydrolase [Luminiphilus syltensis NOR5-1B]